MGKKMVNLVYTIANEKYKEVVNLCCKSIRRYSNIDFCYISSFDLNIEGAMNFAMENFDYKFLSKFMIHKWCNFDKYDNFLFVDSDMICCKNTDIMFEVISQNHNIIHGVKEKSSLQNSGVWFRFSEKVFSENQIGYNSGTFGFNKNMVKLFDELKTYIEKNKHAAICDQPLFNEFFVEKGMVSDSLSPYVYLVGDRYKDINTGKNDVVLKHYLGDYGNNGVKLEKMKKDYDNL